MLKLNTSKEKEIQSKSTVKLEKIYKEENISNDTKNNNIIIKPISTTDSNIEPDELKDKLQESYRIIRKLKEKLINSEQKFENKLIREQEKFYNAEKKISQLEYELVNSRLNRPKSSENQNDTGTDSLINLKPSIGTIENHHSLSSTLSPTILAPPTLSKINPPSSSHLSSSFHTKPPLPSNLSKPLGSIKSANSSSSPLIREVSDDILNDNNNNNINNLSKPKDISSHLNNINNSNNNIGNNASGNNNNNLFKSNSSSLLQKKPFNGTTATIHYLELKLNEKDKEMSVMKDNYEKTIKNLRSNLSKTKMESAIEIFELKNRIKELESQIVNEDEFTTEKNFILNNNDNDGRKSSLSLLSSSTSDGDENELETKDELSFEKENYEDLEAAITEKKSENSESNNDNVNNQNDNNKEDNQDHKSLDIENENKDLQNNLEQDSIMPPSQKLENTNDSENEESKMNIHGSFSKTKILKNNNNNFRPPSLLSSTLSTSSSPLSTSRVTTPELNKNGNYQLQIQKYKTKIKNLQEQLSNKNQLILELSMQLSTK